MGENMIFVVKEKLRDEVIALLEDHQKVNDALLYVGRIKWTAILTLLDADNNDSVECTLHHTTAKAALLRHKEWVEAELAKRGIKIE